MGLGKGLPKVFKLKFKFDTKSYDDTKKLVFLGVWDADRMQGPELEQRQPVSQRVPQRERN